MLTVLRGTRFQLPRQSSRVTQLILFVEPIYIINVRYVTFTEALRMYHGYQLRISSSWQEQARHKERLAVLRNK